MTFDSSTLLVPIGIFGKKTVDKETNLEKCVLEVFEHNSSSGNVILGSLFY